MKWRPDSKGQPSEWHPDTVRMVLKNPRNAGKRAYKGVIVADAVWPALVAEETWQAAVSLMAEPSRYAGGGTHMQAMLTGIALCGVCGGKIHAGAARPGMRGYRCGATSGHVARMAEPIEQFVSAVVVERLSRPDAINLVHDEKKPDIEAMRNDAVALRSRLDSLAVDFADGSLTPSQLRAATARLRALLKVVEERMADAGRVNVLSSLLAAADVQAAWNGLSTPRRRAVVDTLMVVTIHSPGRGVRTFRPDTVGIEWRQS